MLISILDYSKIYERKAMTVMQRCERGDFQTALKIGRNWYIDENEPYFDTRFKDKIFIKKDIGEYSKIGNDDILLSEYAEIKEKGYKGQQQKAIRGGFKTARLIGNQWFINKDE
ncbi:MAG: hypothetical protein RSA99_02975 [Oscillospiraceae bacterium]